MKYVIMCCGGFPMLDKNDRVLLADFPNELQEADFFPSVQTAEEKVSALRQDRRYKYEDFEIMKVHDFEALMANCEDGDLSELEEVKCCRATN